LVVGSLVEIHAQSNGFRTATSAGYGALAARVADASNQTGAQLASLLSRAPQLDNQTIQLPDRTIRDPNLNLARTELQQGLDQAVNSTSEEARQAAQLVPPPPVGDLSDRFTQVMSERATGASDIRTAIDQMLGMTPLPIAGAPSSPAPPSPTPLTSASQASPALTSSGLLFQRADDSYRALLADIRAGRIPIRLPRSVWVPAPVDSAPLGSARLGASASSLSASAALVPFHQLIFSAVGLSPPAVSGGAANVGGYGIVGGGCSTPQAAAPGAVATVLPPTGSVAAAATVTNCGTVAESGVGVRQTLVLSDPPGTALPPASARGADARVTVTLRAGSSTALSLHPMAVASGHLYTLTLTIAIPASQQQNAAGSSQAFLLRIS
jgi:hypothetical protein